MAHADLAPTGCDAFDRGRALLAEGREDDALDAFDLAVLETPDPRIRAAAAAALARLLLEQGRHREARVWAQAVRRDVVGSALADVLEASALVQAGDSTAALALLATVDPGSPVGDGFTEIPASLIRLVRGHALYVLGRFQEATDEVVAAFRADPFLPDVWAAFAALCAETDFDPGPVVTTVPEDRVTEVLGWLDHAPADGIDRIAEALWARFPGQRSLLAFASAFAPYLELSRALEWSARLREVGADDHCPLLTVAAATAAPPLDRARAGVVAWATFGDDRAVPYIEAAAADIPEADLGPIVHEVLLAAPQLAPAFVVAAATTGPRCVALAVAAYREGAVDESLALLARGLGAVDPDAPDDAALVAQLIPADVAEAFAVEADARDAGEVADFLRTVAASAAGD
jgi:tetratricopeptide (TPR) repeat protein